MSVKKVVVVGGGVTGGVASLALAQRGVEVTLVERAPDWRGVGHGITVQGNALAVFREIGVLNAMLEHAHPFETVNICHADGQVTVALDTPRTGGDDLPPTMGALRSDLQDVLLGALHEIGVQTRLGTEMSDFVSTADGIEVALTDGSTANYDLLVAADGIKSATRRRIGVPEDKAPTGMGIWRVVTKRSPEMDCSSIYYHGPAYKAGFTPISDDLCYAYVLTDPVRPDNGLSDIETVRELLAGYHGYMDVVRENLTDGDVVSYQPIEWLHVKGPWHRDRVVLVGDAVHACPPLIAQGAAQCAEDALLLAAAVTAEEVTDADSLERALSAFEARRKPRVQLVVEASMKLVEWELRPNTPDADPAGLMASSLAALTEPA